MHESENESEVAQSCPAAHQAPPSMGFSRQEYWSGVPLQEAWVQSLGQEDSLQEGMTTHSSLLAWEIPWTEETSGLQWGRKRVRYNLVTKQQQ